MGSKTKFKQTEIGMIPEDWEVNKLREVTLQIFSGGTPNTKKEEYWNGDLPWLSSGETSQTFIRDTERKITEKGVKNSSTRLAKKEDVVVAGAGQGHTRGQPSFCLIDTYINQSVVALRANKKELNSYFLFYNLLSRYDELRQLSDAHSSRGSLTTKLLADLLIKLPPLKEQQSIAKILSDLDSKIELNQQMNKTLEAIGQAIFKRWFIDFEFPNEKGKPYKSSGGEMVFNEELGKDIPKGWKVEKIQDLCVSITNGGTPARMENEYWGGDISWFKTGELNDNPLIDSEEHITEEGLKNSACKLWDVNTILIALYASPTVGRLGLLKIKATSNQACSGLVAKREIGYPFLFHVLFFKKSEFNNISVGAAQQNINQKIVQEAKTIIPSYETIEKFNRIIGRVFEKRTEILLQNRSLSQIRDSLLPRLMSGKIRVPIAIKT